MGRKIDGHIIERAWQVVCDTLSGFKKGVRVLSFENLYKIHIIIERKWLSQQGLEFIQACEANFRSADFENTRFESEMWKCTLATKGNMQKAGCLCWLLRLSTC